MKSSFFTCLLILFSQFGQAQFKGTPITVASTQIEDVGLHTSQLTKSTSLGNFLTKIYISYFNKTKGDLVVTYYPDLFSTPSSFIVDSVGVVGEYSSITDINSYVGISYYDATLHRLKYCYFSNVLNKPKIVVLDSISDVGKYSSLSGVRGNPSIPYFNSAISYYDATNGDLKFIRAEDELGNNWATPVKVDTLGDVGTFSCIRNINGYPAISYYDNTNGNLKFVIAKDSLGQTWDTPVILDSIGNVGESISMRYLSSPAIIAISYYDKTNGNLKFISTRDLKGKTWNQAVTLDSLGNVGQYTSLQFSASKPTISYYDQTNGDLKYISANDIDGTSWTRPQIVDSKGDVGKYNSLNNINGNPSISYYDISKGELKFVKINNGIWGNASQLSSLVGQSRSMKVVNGNPAIIYYDATFGDLMYIRALDANGQTWGNPILLDSKNDVGKWASMQLVNGFPAVAYFDYSIGRLKYIRAKDIDGFTWNEPITVDSIDFSGQHCSLQIVNGNPAISYYGGYAQLLKYIRANDVNGTSWGLPKIIQEPFTGFHGYYSSLQVVNGNPAIAYQDGLNSLLEYVRANDPNGNTWGVPRVLESGYTGFWPQLKVVNGKPAIVYYNGTKYDLKYIRAIDSSGNSWSNAIAVDTTGDMGNWPSIEIINGYPAICYGEENTNRMYLRYIRANEPNGETWQAPLTIDTMVNRALFINLQMVNGNPAVSYYDEGSPSLKFIRSSLPTSISTIPPSSVKVYPSVFNDILTIQSPISAIQSVDMINSSGQIVLSKKANSELLLLDTHDLPNGVYFVKIGLTEGVFTTERAIKQK